MRWSLSGFKPTSVYRVAPDWDLWRTLYQPSYRTEATLITLRFWGFETVSLGSVVKRWTTWATITARFCLFILTLKIGSNFFVFRNSGKILVGSFFGFFLERIFSFRNFRQICFSAEVWGIQGKWPNHSQTICKGGGGGAAMHLLLNQLSCSPRIFPLILLRFIVGTA